MVKKILFLFSSFLVSFWCVAQSRYTGKEIQKLVSYVDYLEKQDVLENSGLAAKYAGDKKLIVELAKDSTYKYNRLDEEKLAMYIRHLEKTDTLHLYQTNEIQKMSDYITDLEKTKLPLMAKYPEGANPKMLKQTDSTVPITLTHNDTIFSYDDQEVIKLCVYVKALENFTPPPPPEPVKAPEPIVAAPVAAPLPMAEETIFFSVNSSALNAKSKKILTAFAKKYKSEANVKFNVEGHTDKTGKPAFNIKLSKARARSAKNFLVSKGIPAKNIITEFYGKDRPLDNGSNKKAYAQNRRVSIRTSK